MNILAGGDSLPNETCKSAPRRRWFQFGLRSLLMFVALVACSMAWLVAKVSQGQRQRATIETIDALGGDIVYDFQADPLGNAIPNSKLPGPAWLHALLGDDCFRSVESVTFLRRAVIDAELKPLEQLSTLKHLDFNGAPVGDATMARLADMHGLESLLLTGSSVTDAGLAPLEGMPHLQWLVLDNAAITDIGLLHLARLTELRQLTLQRTRITDAGLETLGRMTQLEFLELNATEVTDSGLKHLYGLAHLKELDLNWTHATKEGMAELQTTLPHCKIVF